MTAPVVVVDASSFKTIRQPYAASNDGSESVTAERVVRIAFVCEVCQRGASVSSTGDVLHVFPAIIRNAVDELLVERLPYSFGDDLVQRCVVRCQKTNRRSVSGV